MFGYKFKQTTTVHRHIRDISITGGEICTSSSQCPVKMHPSEDTRWLVFRITKDDHMKPRRVSSFLYPCLARLAREMKFKMQMGD